MGGPRLGWLRRGYRCERDPVPHHPLGRRHMDRLKNVVAHVLAVAIIAFGFALAILMAVGIYNGFWPP